jgi:hypothetical protein
MLKHFIVALAFLVSAAPALADSWNSNKNIDRAMDAALKTYRATGTTGLVDESQNCYAGLDIAPTNRSMGRDVEYCIAYEFSAAMIDSAASKANAFPPTEKLEFTPVMVRAMAVLDKAKIVRLPEDYEPYLIPRLQRIKDQLPLKM